MTLRPPCPEGEQIYASHAAPVRHSLVVAQIWMSADRVGRKNRTMEAAEARRAEAAARSVAAALNFAVDDAVVLNNSNRLVARLLPCDMVARVSPGDYAHALERLHGALRLLDMGAPHFTDRGRDPTVACRWRRHAGPRG
jgi:hypothetical protein